MDNTSKLALIIATVLVIIGGILFTAVLARQDWSFKNMAGPIETKEYETDDDFGRIFVDVSLTKLKILPSPDGKCRVECTELKNLKNRVEVIDNTLKIEEIDSRAWYEKIFSPYSPRITVYLPEGIYESLEVDCSTGGVTVGEKLTFGQVSISISTGDVSIESDVAGALVINTTTGDVEITSITAGEIDIKVTTGNLVVSEVECKGGFTAKATTGKAELSSIKCQSLTSTATTGEIDLVDVIATDSFEIKRGTGDVEMYRCDAATISIETSTGDISGSLLSGKIFVTSYNTGKVNVPDSSAGGRCEIKTNTGDINITIAE